MPTAWPCATRRSRAPGRDRTTRRAGSSTRCSPTATARCCSTGWWRAGCRRSSSRMPRAVRSRCSCTCPSARRRPTSTPARARCCAPPGPCSRRAPGRRGGSTSGTASPRSSSPSPASTPPRSPPGPTACTACSASAPSRPPRGRTCSSRPSPRCRSTRGPSTSSAPPGAPPPSSPTCVPASPGTVWETGSVTPDPCRALHWTGPGTPPISSSRPRGSRPTGWW